MTIDFSLLKRSYVQPSLLDIVDKQGDKITVVDKSTGETTTFESGKAANVEFYGLVDRFSLQAVARKALPDFRVSKCLRVMISSSHHVSVYKNSKHDSVFFGGLQTCGSVWHCAPCAAKISERRAGEVQHAIDYCTSLGGFVSFVTRTVPHSDADSLQDVLDKIRKAEKIYKGSKWYRSMINTFGVFGQIKVFEITVGVNGWHLHVHEILLHWASTLPDFYKSLENRLYGLWLDAAVKAGFSSPSRKHGLQVQNGDFAAAYLAKYSKESTSNWNSSRELTKQHIKRSKAGYSPFDLMRAYRDTPKKFLLELITEYGQVMHGARQLIWSRGLKEMVGLVDFTDSEIAAQIETEAALLGLLSIEQWRFIIKHDLRLDVLIFAKLHGFEALKAYLSGRGCPGFYDSELFNLDTISKSFTSF